MDKLCILENMEKDTSVSEASRTRNQHRDGVADALSSCRSLHFAFGWLRLSEVSFMRPTPLYDAACLQVNPLAFLFLN